MTLLEAKYHLSAVQCVAVCCSLLQRVAVGCRVCIHIWSLLLVCCSVNRRCRRRNLMVCSAVCGSVLQCVAGFVYISDLYYSCVLQCAKTQWRCWRRNLICLHCSVLQHVAACCSGLQCVYISPIFTTPVLKREKTLLGAALLLVCVAVCKDAMMLLEARSHWSAVQCIAVCCSVSQCVAVCRSVLQGVYIYPIFTTRVCCSV